MSTKPGQLQSKIGLLIGLILPALVFARPSHAGAQQTEAPEWCVNCDPEEGYCILTFGQAGFNKCVNVQPVGSGCTLTQPGCGGSSLLAFSLDGTARVEDVARTESQTGEWEGAATVVVLRDADVGNQGFRRGCSGWVVERKYSMETAVAIAKDTRLISG